MAVEIPVIVDIDGAFQDAAKKVKTAMTPLQRQLSQEALDIKVNVGLDEDGNTVQKFISELVQDFKSGKDVSKELQLALEQLSFQLIQVAQSGDKVRFTTLLEAKQYLQDMATASRVASLEMEGLASTMNGLNARLSAARETLNTSKINSPEWRAAVREIEKVTTAMDKVQRKMAEMGTKAGSIDRINLKIRELTAKWDAMSRAQKFDKDGNLKASAQKVVDKFRQLTQESEKYGLSLAETARKAAAPLEETKQKVREVNTEMNTSNSRLLMLIKNSARLIALHSAASFIRNVREVTAQFELQRVALGSIIQDTEKASSLFKQIKAAAVESPFEIKDLVTYTKQLSAYQIETEKLFDTTMKLGDISAGLGVDMNRLILAFGQVRAAAVLRGQELRQFTEAGIPLVDKLAQKFTELNGRAVTTAEVFELISKRAVPFAMIEEIFNDLTSAGGAFYKMQEKQAETLLGQWNNLKDAVSIMYDEIGNTTTVHNAMEALIGDARYIMQNWRTIANVVKIAGAQFLALKFASAFLPTLSRSTKLLEKAEIAEARAKELSNRAHGKGVMALSANSMRAYYYYTLRAARSTTAWGRAVNQLKGFLAGNWLSLVITAVTILGARLISAAIEAGRLNRELAKIKAEGNIKADQSVREFERLANAAVEAADGSREQQDAIEALKREYEDILPANDNLIDSLREMKGNYDSLTESIRQKIMMQIREQEVEEVTGTYSTKVGDKQKKIKKLLKDQGLTSEEISAVMAQLRKAVESGLISVEDGLETQAKKIEKIIYDYTGKYVKITRARYSQIGAGATSVYVGEQATALSRNFKGLIKDLTKMDAKIEEIDADFSDAVGEMGVYAQEWKDLQEEISNFEDIGETQFAKAESKISRTVDKYISFLQEKFQQNGIDISDALTLKDPDFDILKKLAESINDDQQRIALTGVLKKIQKEYENLVPDDKIVAMSKQILSEAAANVGISMDKMRAYIKAAGKDNKEYLKEIQESYEGFLESAKEMRAFNEKYKDTLVVVPYTDQQIKEADDMASALKVLADALAQIFTLPTKGTTDRLQKVRQSISDITDAYKKYQELMAAEGTSAAQRDIATLFPDLKGWVPSFESMIEKLEGMLSQYRGDADATRLVEQAIANIKFEKLKSDMEKALKRLSDEIKRSETAKKFYDSILDMTGNENLAMTMSMEVYGETGEALKKKIQDSLRTSFVLDDAKVEADNLNVDEVRETIKRAITEQDTKTLRKYLGYVVEDNQKAADDVLAGWEKEQAEYIEGLYKTYQKAKTYEERMTDVRNREAEARKKIAEDRALTPEQKESFTAASLEKEAREIASIEVEALKDTYEWGKIFEDLDRVGNETLKNLKENIEKVIEAQEGFLSVEQLKALTEALDKIRTTGEQRDPLSAIISGGTRSLLLAPALLSKSGSKEQDEAIAKIKEYNSQVEKTDQIDLDHLDDAFRDANKTMEDGINGLADYLGKWQQIIETVSSTFNLDEVPILGEALDSASKALGAIATILPVIITLNEVLNKVLMSNPILFAAGAVIAAVATIAGIIKGIVNLKLSRLQKEFDKQKKILEDLEESYGNLDRAIQKAFGNDYVANYTQQLQNLQAQQEAYLKQAENREQAARTAKKKKDKEQYREEAEEAKKQAREVAVNIEELNDSVSAFFAGQDLASAAEAFADAWLSAYQEFGDTSQAIEERMTEMVQNIMKKAALSGIAESVLGGWYESLADVQDWNAQTIAEKWRQAMELVDPMVQGMQTFANSMQAEGMSLRQLPGQFTGIKRDIAGASEESINGLAAGINTQNFYMSYISQNVAAILTYLTGGTTVPASTATGAASDPYKDTVLLNLASLPQMRDDLYEIRRLLSNVIKPTGTTATHYVATNL